MYLHFRASHWEKSPASSPSLIYIRPPSTIKVRLNMGGTNCHLYISVTLGHTHVLFSYSLASFHLSQQLLELWGFNLAGTPYCSLKTSTIVLKAFP